MEEQIANLLMNTLYQPNINLVDDKFLNKYYHLIDKTNLKKEIYNDLNKLYTIIESTYSLNYYPKLCNRKS